MDKKIIMAIILVNLKYIVTKKSLHKSPRSDRDIRQMLHDMLKGYDNKLRPYYLGSAVEVTVDATIMSISQIDEVNMMYTLDMFFRQRWKDHRLKHSMNDTLTLIVGTKQPVDIIWVPDTVFIDSVTSHLHRVTVNNHKLDISPDGSLFWGTRVTVSPACQLDLRAYPMDQQICPFTILSYAYTSQHIKYKWLGNPGIIANNIKMAQFTLLDYHTEEHTHSYVAGNFTQLEGEFRFKRLIGFAIMQIYAPSICVAIVSWISLWINRGAVPARVALCIINLLTILSFWSSINTHLPRVNYVKAIDIYMMTTFTFVILTLVEYTIVLNAGEILEFLNRGKREPQLPHLNNLLEEMLQGEKADIPFVNNGPRDNEVPENERNKGFKQREDILANSIEWWARMIFPVMYVTFLALYFDFYLKYHKH